MVFKAFELKNTATANKPNLRNLTIDIPINKKNYKFKIGGVGSKAIKLEKFFYYSDIINTVQSEDICDLEFLIEQVIVDPTKRKTPVLDDYVELRERALANKQKLKSQYVNVFIGEKEYGFRLAGIGARSIKLEVYVGYDDIANELNSGNDLNLEYILKELIVGNEIDYDKFSNIDSGEKSQNDDKIEDIIDDFQKLSNKQSEELMSEIKGLQKLVFDAINSIKDDLFTIEDVLNQDLIKSYEVQGESFEPIVVKNINELIEIGLIDNVDDFRFIKLWM